MPGAKKLLDTSTPSAVMKQRDRHVQERAREYLHAHRRFTFSILTRYEILRGLKAKRAGRQIERFDRQCVVSEILPLTDSIVLKATDIYASLHERGKLIGDADTLIAATAVVHGLGLVTENTDHFIRIPELNVESWRAPADK